MAEQATQINMALAKQTSDTNVATGDSPDPGYPCDPWQQPRPQRPWFWYDHGPRHGSLQQPGPLDVTMAPGGIPGHSNQYGPQTVMWPQVAAQARDTDIGTALGSSLAQMSLWPQVAVQTQGIGKVQCGNLSPEILPPLIFF